MENNWTENERAILDAILNRLIPANPQRGIKAAGDLGVANFLAAITEHNTDYSVAFKSLLQQAAAPEEITTHFISKLEQELPIEFQMLLCETYKGYYSRADARKMVGVGSHPVHPLGYEVAPESAELLDSLTAPVRKRGRCYRDTKGIDDE